MKILIVALSFIAFAASSVLAAEAVEEKLQAKTNDIGRAVKAKAHRVGEKFCDDKEKCLVKKVNNRANEGGEYAKDKANEAGNIIDNDKKD